MQNRIYMAGLIIAAAAHLSLCGHLVLLALGVK